MNNSIGSFLAALRKANGLTQKQLADKLNVSDKAVSRWERDECAPDLSLIPVLAELYGVTSDEILRGRRADPITGTTPQAEEKSKKRLQYLLNQITTRFKLQSLISVGIAMTGMTAAMILNAFNHAQAGFLVGCIFFLAATICQAIFLINARSRLMDDDFDDAAIAGCRHKLIVGSEWVFSIIAILVFAAAPLLLADDPFWGLTVPYWWHNGLISMSIPALLCPIICHIINTKAGITRPINWKTPKNILRIRTIATLLIVLMATTLLQGLFGWWLDEHIASLGDAIKFETLESFKSYMEQPMSDSGELLTYYKTVHDETGREIDIYHDSQNAEYWYYPEHIQQSVYNKDGEVILSYQLYNDNVGYITYSSTDDCLPILVQTTQQRIASNDMFDRIMLCWIPVYPLELILFLLQYRKKAKTL